MKTIKKYKIPLDKGYALVNEFQIMKPRWVLHFGGEDKIKEFIKNNKL